MQLKQSRIGLAVGLALLVLVLVGGLGLPTARATTSTYTAAGVTITKGSTVSGTYANTQADDASYHRVADDALYYMDLYYVLGPFSIADESWMSRIDTRWQAKQAGSKLHNLYWYDFDGAAWVDMGAGTFGASDTNIDDYQTSTLARFRNSTGYFRFRYYYYDGEPVTDLYSDYIYVTYTWAVPNYAPVNLQASCKNLDDTDNLYARYQAYTFTSNTSDANGYADLNYIDLLLLDGPGPTIRWTVRFTEATNAFSEQTGGADITLNTASCSYVKSGNWINLTWSITIEWTHPEDADDDLKLYAIDDASASDFDTYNTNYDVGTKLDGNVLVHDAFNADDRGSLNGVLHLHVSPWYYIEPTAHPNPPVAEVDFWVTCANVSSSPWSQTAPTSYPVEVVCAADDEVGLDWYSLKIVANDAGYSGTNLLHATGHEDSYISDRVNVTFASMTYWKLPLGQNASGIIYTKVFAYDGAPFTGTVTLNDTDFAHATAGSYGYTVASVSGGAYGVSSFYTNNQTVIWETLSYSIAYTWMRVTGGEYWVRLDLINLVWSVEATTIPDAAVFTFYENASLFHTASPSSGQLIDVVEDYKQAWYYVTWTVKITYTTAPYNFSLYLFVSVGPVEVPVEHTLYIETFDSGLTDYYFSFYVETNWRNACCAVWVNGSSMTYFSSEGWHQIAKPTGLGVWNITILVNGSAPLGSAYQHYGLGSGAAWKYRWTLIEVQAETTLFFYFYDLNGEPISWGSEAQPFLVYVNGTQAPHQGLWIRSSVSTVNITIVDLWGYTLYANTSYAIQTVGDTVVRLQLTMWRLVLVNRQKEPVYAIVGFNLYNRTFYVDKGGFAPLNVYAGSFEVWWYRAADGHFIEHEGPVTLTADRIFFTAYEPETPPSGGGGAEDTTPWWAKDPYPTIILGVIIAIVGVAIIVSSRRANRQTQVLLGGGPQPEPKPETPESAMEEANERQQAQIEESVRQMSGKSPKKKRRSKKH